MTEPEHPHLDPGWPSRLVRVLIETPKGSFLKRDSRGRIDFVSPLPCPFNYGSVEGTRAADGEPVDALVLGPRLPRGTTVVAHVLGRARFVDAGEPDDKWLCALEERELRAAERRSITRFFRVYALVKRAANARRRPGGPTAFSGLA